MSSTYRQSRNIEATLIDKINSILSNAGFNATIRKTFKQVYNIPINPNTKTCIICVRVGTTSHNFIEIGSNSTVRNPLVLIDIFASDDGQRLDIKDCLIAELKGGCRYYEYVINNGSVQSKTENGRIRVLDIDDTPLNFDTEKDELDPHDRFRHLITLTVSTGKVET